MIDPFANPDENSEALRLLRKVGNHRDEIGERLARHEFMALQRELRSGLAFNFEIDLGGAPVAIHGEQSDGEVFKKGLPVLPVPLGRIAWVSNATSMPVIGILLETVSDQELASQLLGLLSEHHRAPFAKLLFIARDFKAIPLLGRYGFAYHVTTDQNLDHVGRGLNKRFGMQQIRSLQTQAQLWAL